MPVSDGPSSPAAIARFFALNLDTPSWPSLAFRGIVSAVLTAGDRLDRYELLRPIASGGMATVWLARLRGKRGFEKLVAIKTIRTELISDAKYAEMFLDEARIASLIHHPNVAQIFDLGEQDDVLYLVMEWVDGDSLAKICRASAQKATPLPLHLALRVMADACAGLHAAHELRDGAGRALGVVHRDVSPQNILVTNGGSAKVIDFGLAKAEQRNAPDTKAGVVKGKIRYLSPEYVNGKGIDRRADIWACGICLYELVTGQAPYDDLEDLDVVRRLMQSPDPAPDLEDERVPSLLRPILQRSLAREPEARYPTALAMRKAIEFAIDELEASATTEDVGEFLTNVLPELAEQRKRTVDEVISTARTTIDETARTTSDIPEPPESDPVALTKRKSAPSYQRGPDKEASSTAAATLTEQLGERPRSRVGTGAVAGLAALGLGVLAAMAWSSRGHEAAPAAAPIATASQTASAAPPAPPPLQEVVELSPATSFALPARPAPAAALPSRRKRAAESGAEQSDPLAAASAVSAAQAALHDAAAAAPAAPAAPAPAAPKPPAPSEPPPPAEPPAE